MSRSDAAEERRIEDVMITGSRCHPGSQFRYAAWKPEGLAAGAAVYVLLEHDAKGPTRGLLEGLMASGAIPPGIVVWTFPGTLPSAVAGGVARNMRASEYDQPGTAFPDFLVEELVPDAAARLGVSVNPSPELHFIAGGSSGGICAWNAAWCRNDFFRRVFLSSPTFSAMRSGEELMTVVRKCETRPIRIYMTVGTDEPDYFFGDSFLVALNAASAFKHAGYEHRFEVFEHEGHCSRREDPALWNRMMPWLFAGWQRKRAVAAGGNPPRVRMLLAPGSKWKQCAFAMPPPRTAVVSTDGSRVYSVSPSCRFVTAESIMPDGSRAWRYDHAPVHLAWNSTCVGAKAIALLADDRVLVATELGVQGIVSFGLTDLILPLPGDRPADNLAVVSSTLYVSSSGAVFKRALAVPAADPADRNPPSSPGYGDGPYNREHLPIGV